MVWIHNDYSFECARGDNGTDFNAFDRIICVSEATKSSFSQVFPNLKNRLTTIYNVINSDYIKRSAKKFFPKEYDSEKFNIVSVGRISYQKNFDIIPVIIASLPNDSKQKIRWYIIGTGSETESLSLRRSILYNGVSENCILLGTQNNPYPYIYNANLFVLTSRYESYPTVINEALVLDTPIISIDIPPVHEMLDNKCIFTINSMAKAIDSTIKGTISPVSIWPGAETHNKKVLSQLEELF